jgi:hypothetical protein
MSEKQQESLLSRLLWFIVPFFIGIAIVALILISEANQYSFLGNVLYGTIGLFLTNFGLWKLYVLFQILLKKKKPTHHGKTVSPGSFHYRLLMFHAWFTGLIFPIAGLYLIYLAVSVKAM